VKLGLMAPTRGPVHGGTTSVSAHGSPHVGLYLAADKGAHVSIRPRLAAQLVLASKPSSAPLSTLPRHRGDLRSRKRLTLAPLLDGEALQEDGGEVQSLAGDGR
jgi:hypothetical protein